MQGFLSSGTLVFHCTKNRYICSIVNILSVPPLDSTSKRVLFLKGARNGVFPFYAGFLSSGTQMNMDTIGPLYIIKYIQKVKTYLVKYQWKTML